MCRFHMPIPTSVIFTYWNKYKSGKGSVSTVNALRRAFPTQQMSETKFFFFNVWNQFSRCHFCPRPYVLLPSLPGNKVCPYMTQSIDFDSNCWWHIYSQDTLFCHWSTYICGNADSFRAWGRGFSDAWISCSSMLYFVSQLCIFLCCCSDSKPFQFCTPNEFLHIAET